jgi:hypothetical protein
VEDLTYLDSDPSIATSYSVKKGEKGLIRSFIHFMHYHKEMNNQIGDDWITATLDLFKQFRVNLDYTRCFGTLLNLPSTAIASGNNNCSPTTSTPTPAPTHALLSTVLSPVEMFKRGERRQA